MFCFLGLYSHSYPPSYVCKYAAILGQIIYTVYFLKSSSLSCYGISLYSTFMLPVKHKAVMQNYTNHLSHFSIIIQEY